MNLLYGDIVTLINTIMIKLNKDTKEFSGIYLIYNKISSKGYIGSSKHVRKRVFGSGSHLYYLRKNAHDNRHLQRAFNKHGIDCFEFYKLVECPEEYLIRMEQFFIDNYKSEYNLCKIAGKGGCKRTEEQLNLLYRGQNNPRTTVVCAYNRQGELVSQHLTAENASKAMTVKIKVIIASIFNNKETNRTLGGGYYWKSYKKNIEIPTQIIIAKKKLDPQVFIAENETICHIFKSQREVETVIKCSRKTLKKYINLNEKYHGYNWRIKEN